MAKSDYNNKTKKIKPEIDEDVNNEHDVHNEVHHIERRAGVTTTLLGYFFLRGEMPG